MVRNALILLMAVLATGIGLVVAGCGSSNNNTQTSANAAFCTSLASFDQQKNQFESTVKSGPTKSEVQTAYGNLKTSFDNVKSAAQNAKNVSTDALQSAWDGLTSAVQGVTSASSLQVGLTAVKNSFAPLDQAVNDLKPNCGTTTGTSTAATTTGASTGTSTTGTSTGG
jgi:hypothetical protein